MSWLCLFFFLRAASAESFRIEPSVVKQGQVLKVFGDRQSRTAKLENRSIPLFAEKDGTAFGWMPVGVLTRPGIYVLTWNDEAGKTLHSTSVHVFDAHYAKQNVILTPALSQLRSTSDERETVTSFLRQVSPVRYWQEPFEAPIPGCITSPFGVTRLHNGKPTGDFHAGIDQRGAVGTPIHAVTGGVVKVAQTFALHGGTVAIDHGEGLESMYLHMSEIAAKPGEQVKRGDIIGYVGSTGRSTGPHLHWSLYANGEPISPLQWVSLSPCPANGVSQRRPR